jgi:hypothetical protein
VYYKKETRHDNGQLVDFSERRKVDEKFDMKNPCAQENFKIVLRTMRRGDIAWIRLPKAYTHGNYHQICHFQRKTPEEKALIGDDIYIRFQVTKIKRNPVCTDSQSFEGIYQYLEKVRDVGKELIDEGEFVNA